MGDGVKPKIEGQKKPWCQRQNNNQSEAKPKKQISTPHSAPTVGLEDMVFKRSSMTDAADSEDTKKLLGQHCAVQFDEGGVMMQRAFQDMVAPVLEEPSDPSPTATAVEVKKWERQINAFDHKKRAWEDASVRAFQLVLMHFHPDVEERIKSFDKWTVVDASQDVVKLLKLIRCVLHKCEEIKQGAMAYMEQDLRLMTMHQKPEWTPSQLHKAAESAG
jgi:hypothetical protein